MENATVIPILSFKPSLHTKDDSSKFKEVNVMFFFPFNCEAMLPLPPTCTNGLSREGLWVEKVSTCDAHITSGKVGSSSEQLVELRHGQTLLSLCDILTTILQ